VAATPTSVLILIGKFYLKRFRAARLTTQAFPRSFPQMDVQDLSLPGLKLLKPRRFADSRGFFVETYNERAFAQAGITAKFVQDNQSLSIAKRTVRALHFQ